MLVLFTAEKLFEKEGAQIKEILEMGAAVLHVRKPGISKEEMYAWLQQFQPEHLAQMVLHQHQELADEFVVKGVHLPEYTRNSLAGSLEEYMDKYQGRGFTVSTSFHEIETLKSFSNFDYCFLSPIFSSISKSNYEGRHFEVKGFAQKIIALGGITPDKFSLIKEMGFAGGAVLGAVWGSENPALSFEEIWKGYKLVFD
ncbi:thiamine phosphate synthase [Flammeovirgaceae bacterium SG7u.111]|nr:thiamine phosphate synthase [Flammeovirgaceae bacterium SG7u.132]WPO36960.1 thiamine phosphate synthase [Flammeovirgaceae bacterium SG7u.111]